MESVGEPPWIGLPPRRRRAAERLVDRMLGQQRIRRFESVVAIARPREIGPIRHHVGAQLVSLDIAMTGEEIGLAVEDGRSVAALPQRAGAPVAAVDMSDVAAAEQLEDPRQRIGTRRREEQMKMIAHQHIGMEETTLRRQRGSEPAEVELPVAVGEEDRHPVVAALNDMMDLAPRQQTQPPPQPPLPPKA